MTTRTKVLLVCVLFFLLAGIGVVVARSCDAELPPSVGVWRLDDTDAVEVFVTMGPGPTRDEKLWLSKIYWGTPAEGQWSILKVQVSQTLDEQLAAAILDLKGEQPVSLGANGVMVFDGQIPADGTATRHVDLGPEFETGLRRTMAEDAVHTVRDDMSKKMSRFRRLSYRDDTLILHTVPVGARPLEDLSLTVAFDDGGSTSCAPTQQPEGKFVELDESLFGEPADVWLADEQTWTVNRKAGPPSCVFSGDTLEITGGSIDHVMLSGREDLWRCSANHTYCMFLLPDPDTDRVLKGVLRLQTTLKKSI